MEHRHAMEASSIIHTTGERTMEPYTGSASLGLPTLLAAPASSTPKRRPLSNGRLHTAISLASVRSCARQPFLPSIRLLHIRSHCAKQRITSLSRRTTKLLPQEIISSRPTSPHLEGSESVFSQQTSSSTL